jgi:hypothetical protein
MNTKIVNGTEYHDGYFVSSRKLSVMEGKLLTTVELLGLPDQQSEALKSEMRQILWGRGVMAYGIYLEAEEIAEVAESKHNPEKEDRSIKV